MPLLPQSYYSHILIFKHVAHSHPSHQSLSKSTCAKHQFLFTPQTNTSFPKSASSWTCPCSGYLPQPGIFVPCPFRLTSYLIPSPIHSPSITHLDPSAFHSQMKQITPSQSHLVPVNPWQKLATPRPRQCSQVNPESQKQQSNQTTRTKMQKKKSTKKETICCKGLFVPRNQISVRW